MSAHPHRSCAHPQRLAHRHAKPASAPGPALSPARSQDAPPAAAYSSQGSRSSPPRPPGTPPSLHSHTPPRAPTHGRLSHPAPKLTPTTSRRSLFHHLLVPPLNLALPLAQIHAPPCVSAINWISICLGRSISFSRYTSPDPKLRSASLLAAVYAAAKSSFPRHRPHTLPPPPAAAFSITGYPIPAPPAPLPQPPPTRSRYPARVASRPHPPPAGPWSSIPTPA